MVEICCEQLEIEQLSFLLSKKPGEIFYTTRSNKKMIRFREN